MQTVVECTNGKEYYSDNISDEDMQKFLDENNFILGTYMNGEEVVAHTPAEAVDAAERIFNEVFNHGNGSINIERAGRKRYFNIQNVVCFSILR